MNRPLLLQILFLLSAVIPSAHSQEGPFDPEAWPPTANPAAKVHYFVAGDDPDALPPPPGAGWVPSLSLANGGDQTISPLQVGGYQGMKATQDYLNVIDAEYAEWADEPVIDILVLVYGDAAVLSSSGNPRSFRFLLGSLPELSFQDGGQLPVEAKNFRWNWVLFRVENGERPSDGGRFTGTIAADAEGNFAAGGVNGGTIRFEGVPGLTVRAVAFGSEGAFGSPEAINLFAPQEECEPIPDTNHVWVDIHAGTNFHLQVLNDGDQLTTILPDVGPPGDRRTAVVPLGLYLNTGITDNYLGFPCNEPQTVKLCVDYYDDPDMAGVKFGPEAYATDAHSGIGFVSPDLRATIEGSGMWIRRSWRVGGVSLRGVNTGALTGGVRLHFEAPVAISRIDLAVIRQGDHPLAGQDPLASCAIDPAVCAGIFGDYAEMDLAAGFFSGIAPGDSTGDQKMVQEDAGPPGDIRPAIRPDPDAGRSAPFYLNFAITDEVFGPTSQPNARLAVALTYFDDAMLAGATLRPEAYRTELADGTTAFRFFPENRSVILQGSNRWVEAYWEIPDVKLEGVNQGPQAAARFAASDLISVSRVRYAVIRDCGPHAGRNLLAHAMPSPRITRPDANTVRVAWPAGHPWRVQFRADLDSGEWQTVTDPPEVIDFENVLDLPLPDPAHGWFRLAQ